MTEITMDELVAKLNDTIATLVKTQVEAALKEVSISKEVDRKNLGGEGDEAMTAKQKVAKFLCAVVNGDAVEAKAMSEGTSSAGGYLVPTEFRAVIVEKLLKQAVIRPEATVLPMSRESLDIPVEANTVTMYWAAESAALTESDPTFSHVLLQANKLTGLSKMSRELFADAEVNLIDYLSNLFAKRFAQEEDKQFMTGSGTGLPKGIRQYSFSQTMAQAGAHLTADDLINLVYLLPVAYRKNAKFIMHNNIINVIRLLKDSYGRYLWVDGGGISKAPATLLGYPVLEQNDIPTNLGGGTNASEIYFGDVSYYLIGDRQAMEVESTTVGAGTFENNQVALKVIERIDGQLSLTDAFAQMTGVIK